MKYRLLISLSIPIAILSQVGCMMEQSAPSDAPSSVKSPPVLPTTEGGFGENSLKDAFLAWVQHRDIQYATKKTKEALTSQPALAVYGASVGLGAMVGGLLYGAKYAYNRYGQISGSLVEGDKMEMVASIGSYVNRYLLKDKPATGFFHRFFETSAYRQDLIAKTGLYYWGTSVAYLQGRVSLPKPKDFIHATEYTQEYAKRIQPAMVYAKNPNRTDWVNYSSAQEAAQAYYDSDDKKKNTVSALANLIHFGWDNPVRQADIGSMLMQVCNTDTQKGINEERDNAKQLKVNLALRALTYLKATKQFHLFK